MIRHGYGYSGPVVPTDMLPIHARAAGDWDIPVVVIDRASAYEALRAAIKVARRIEEDFPYAQGEADAIREAIRVAMRAAGAYVREDAS